MDAQFPYCKIPLLTISSAAIIGNVLMITFAVKRQLLNGSISYLIYSLGLVDILFSSLVLTRTTITAVKGAHGHGMPSTGHLIFRFIGFTFTIVQLTTQTAIGCERFVTVKFPIIYRSTLANSSRKWILLSIWIGSAAAGLAVVIPSILLGYPRAISIFCCGVYSLAMTLTAGMYLFMFKEVRDNNKRMRKTADSTGDANKKRQEKSHIQEQEIFYLAVGIVSTYFVLNTPLNIYSAFYESSSRVASLVAQPCNTTNGVFANIAICLASLNKFCDPILYFYVRYRMTKRRNNQVKANETTGFANAARASGPMTTGTSGRSNTETSRNSNAVYVGVKAISEGWDQDRTVIAVQSENSTSCNAKYVGRIGDIGSKERMGRDDVSISRQRSSKKNQPKVKGAEFHEIFTEVEGTRLEERSDVAKQDDQEANINEMGNL